LAAICTKNHTIKSPQDLQKFLQWQAHQRVEPNEQKRFREDALGYLHLLVFAVMQKKSPYIHLIHSAGIYPNVSGADRDWCGKSIGFLGDRTQVATQQVVELGCTTAWGWEEDSTCMDVTKMLAFFAIPDNKEKCGHITH